MANNNLVLIVVAIIGVFLFSGGITGNALISQKQLQTVAATTSAPNVLNVLPGKLDSINTKLTSIDARLNSLEDIVYEVGDLNLLATTTAAKQSGMQFKCLISCPSRTVIVYSCGATAASGDNACQKLRDELFPDDPNCKVISTTLVLTNTCENAAAIWDANPLAQ